MLGSDLLTLATSVLGAQASVFGTALENSNLKISEQCRSAALSSAVPAFSACGGSTMLTAFTGTLDLGANSALLANACTDTCTSAIDAMLAGAKSKCSDSDRSVVMFAKNATLPAETRAVYDAVFAGQSIDSLIKNTQGLQKFLCVKAGGTQCATLLQSGKCDACLNEMARVADESKGEAFYTTLRSTITAVQDRVSQCKLKDGSAPSGAFAGGMRDAGLFVAVLAGFVLFSL